MHYIVGLGNKDEKLIGTRHNAGKIFVEFLQTYSKFPDWKYEKKHHAYVSKGVIDGEGVTLVIPDSPMNTSGSVIKHFIKNTSSAKKLILIHDELDLPSGAVKVSFGRGSGGHKGVESVARALKTKEYFRIRIGISPKTPSGKIKKPSSDAQVVSFVLGKFTPNEKEFFLKKTAPKIFETLPRIFSGEIKQGNTTFSGRIA